MWADIVLSFSGQSLFWACAVSRRSRAASRWLIAPAHHCTRPRHRQGFIGDHRLQRGDACCSVVSMVASPSPSAVNTSTASFSRRRSRWARSDDASHGPRMLPASMSACPYLLPSSTETRIPDGFSGWPSGHLLRCKLEWRTSKDSGNPMPHRHERASP